MAIEDYGRILSNAGAAMPDFAGLVQQGRLGAQLGQLAEQQQIQQAQAQAAAVETAARRQADVEAALRNPTSAAFSGLMTRYPDLSKEFKAAWDVQDEGARNADLSALGSVVASISNGRADLALQAVKARVDADKAAGVGSAAAQSLLDALESGNTMGARGIAAYMIAAAAGPEKLDALVNGDPKVVGDALVDREGQMLFKGTAAPKYQKIDKFNADGVKVGEEIVQFGGDGAATGGGARGGFDAFYRDFLAPTEGGYAARDGKSGAPVNFGVNQAANPDVDVAALTQPQAAAILKERYWDAAGTDAIADPALQAIHADTAVNMGVGTAKAMLAAAKGDPARYLGLREARYRRLGGPDLPAWLARNAKLRDYVGGAAGGPKVVYSSTPGAAAEDNGLMGEAYLDSLPLAKRGLVSAIVRGDFPITAKMTSPAGLKLFEAAARVDPTISAANYPKRVQTMKDFSSSGKSGQAITSIETLANHLYTLAEASDELGGTNTFGRPGNWLMNQALKQSNTTAFIKYQSAIDKIAPELDKFLSGKAATVSGQQEARESFNVNMGPAGRKQAIATTIELILGRLGPIGEGFSRGMDRNVSGSDLLKPDKRAQLEAINQWAAGGDLAKVEAKAPAPVKVDASKTDAATAAKLRAKYGLK